MCQLRFWSQWQWLCCLALHRCLFFSYVLFFFKYVFIYLAIAGLSCGLWDLSSSLIRDWTWAPALGALNLRLWITREVPKCLFFWRRWLGCKVDADVFTEDFSVPCEDPGKQCLTVGCQYDQGAAGTGSISQSGFPRSTSSWATASLYGGKPSCLGTSYCVFCIGAAAMPSSFLLCKLEVWRRWKVELERLKS